MTFEQTSFPHEEGIIYLAEGGTETEVMYRHGHQLREFAMFELLNKPDAVSDMKDMYRRYLDVAAKHECAALMAGFDYRASPDWGEKLGYSREGLREMQHKCIDFLREVSTPYKSQLPRIAIAGCIGPRGDAYSLNKSITSEEAEEYHATQMETLKECGVDLVWAATLNNIPEAVGVSRAAAGVGLPVNISFTLDSTHKLKSGPSLKEAIEATDELAGDARPDSYGINCSHPLEFEPALEPGDWTNRIRSLRPNAAKMDKVSLCRLDHIEEGDPEELGQMMGDLARRYPHIDVWGGCCGTWDKHFDRIAHYVQEARRDVSRMHFLV
ncbi:homocysteine S-methyltransferase family protein [Aliiroseovarius sp. KMU-50]|uniref:Homocysteine S-methyltransferase family protein n=1 Tax=Aliiroseovarius salicola TaxID=3009082 RepID=A0ABT4VYI6_9RHOB|nr:homocysteine S-methyltransferase family protein [Aliiroseovarius sp. KMU-50]MDA5093312.1 homocysteine S-methyltransferase family protein [Aliiroseovarius sp. KMU-50]